MNKAVIVLLILLLSLSVADVYAIVVEEPISKTTVGDETSWEHVVNVMSTDLAGNRAYDSSFSIIVE